MSGADLANLINEAALHAVRRGAPAIAMQDIEAARDRVLMDQSYVKDEKQTISGMLGSARIVAFAQVVIGA